MPNGANVSLNNAIITVPCDDRSSFIALKLFESHSDSFIYDFTKFLNRYLETRNAQRAPLKIPMRIIGTVKINP